MVSRPIIIPSKNIYAKDNQKVIKNLVDYIEVDQKIPQIISDTQNVYNEKVNADYNNGQTQTDLEGHTGYYVTAGGRNYQAVISYIQETPLYVTKSITIPKTINNSTILSILPGKDNNDNPNIKISIAGIIENSEANGTATTNANSSQNLTNATYTIANINTGIITPSPPKVYQLTDKIINDSNTITEYIAGGSAGGGNPYVTVTSSISLNNLDNILSATADKNADNYTITLTILAGLKTIKLSGTSKIDANSVSGDFSFNTPLKGTVVNYIPNYIELSFYGDIIKLDLQNNTLTISNGKNTYSFSGNELMQSTNSPSVVDTYQKVISQYENGKEVATLKCNIDDYYDTEGNLAVSPYQQWIYTNPVTISKLAQQSSTFYYVNSKPTLSYNDVLYYENEQATVTGLQGAVAIIQVEENGLIANALDKVGELVVNLDTPPTKTAMTFHIGDTVIPYVYTAKGEDKPMSYYVDNTPKEFIVVGRGISYKGRAYQTLTLQEITKDINTNS